MSTHNRTARDCIAAHVRSSRAGLTSRGGRGPGRYGLDAGWRSSAAQRPIGWRFGRLPGSAEVTSIAGRCRGQLGGSDLPIELVTLPAKIVRASYTWASDDHWVAFLTQASGGPSNADFVVSAAGAIPKSMEEPGVRYFVPKPFAC
jgi:hypothetical protein